MENELLKTVHLMGVCKQFSKRGLQSTGFCMPPFKFKFTTHAIF